MGSLRPLSIGVSSIASLETTIRWNADESAGLQLTKQGTDLTSGFLSTARKSFVSRATHGVRTMNGTAARFLRLGVSLSGLGLLGWVLTGQAAKPAQEGLPTDWTHRHVIFSQPSTYEQVRQVTKDPRYWQQFYRQAVTPVVSDPEPDHTMPPNLGFVGNSERQGDWSEDLGSSPSGVAGTYPAKYSFQITTANCGSATTPDYVVFSTGLLGSATQASVVGYDNLYSGCSGVKPTVYWAFNTGGQVLTSPATSTDGKQVAFVETNSSVGILVLLKWAAGSGAVASPTTLAPVTLSAYRACTAPCMTEIFLKGGGTQTDDTTSSVFPDYTHDVLWVGGALGWLHKITGAFRGTPAEVNTGGFPVQTNVGHPAGNSLSSPVYDYSSTNVFVGDYGGFFYRISSTGVVTKSAQLDHGTGLVAGPIVDSTSGKVYVFASSDGTTACPGGVPCAAVYQFTTGFAAATSGAKVTVGSSQVAPPNPNPLYEGSFDSTYQASANATGNLYVCGNTAGAPTLYQIPITAGAMGTVNTGPTLAGAATGCSPVSDIPNPNAAGGTAEWIFASAQNSGSGNNCAAGGCIMNFNVQPWTPSTNYVAGQEVIDTNFHVQVVRTPGTSRTAAQGHPIWTAATDGATNDGSVRWINQGPHVAAHVTWLPSHAYAIGNIIIDSNNNVEYVAVAGTSRTVAQGHPVWSLVINGATIDAGARWRNLGPIATQSAAAAGGTGGIIMDNTVPVGTLPGASQIYYSTQGNQVCATSGGTGGCAVQASQSGLN